MVDALHPDVIRAGLLDTASHSSCPSCRSVAAAAHARLEALEEIRRRVADGWIADCYSGNGNEHGEWVRYDRDPEPIPSEVAAVLWPTTEPDGG